MGHGVVVPARGHSRAPLPDHDPARERGLARFPALWRVHGVFRGLGPLRRVARHEIGVFTDPYQYFGGLNAELWRAIRLVVDTGIHAKGWSRQQVLEKANARIQAELDQLKRQVSQPAAASGSPSQVDTTFIDALGFGGQNLSDEEITRINRLAGEVFREMISGLMQVLGSRSSIKNEFRINVTTIQPVENNPLKFSANVDDALENMFLKQGNAFKKPVESVREGFDGVAEHQVAVLAGIR